MTTGKTWKWTLDGQTAQAVRDMLGDDNEKLEGETEKAYKRVMWERNKDKYNAARRRAWAEKPPTKCDDCGVEVKDIRQHRKYHCPGEVGTR